MKKICFLLFALAILLSGCSDRKRSRSRSSRTSRRSTSFNSNSAKNSNIENVERKNSAGEKRKPMTAEKTEVCPTCNGSGQTSGYTPQKCTNCTIVNTPMGISIGSSSKCSVCKGSGGTEGTYLGYQYKIPCNVCFGYGYMKCKECYGHGVKYPMTTGKCHHCNGKRRIAVQDKKKFDYSKQRKQLYTREANEIITNYVMNPGYPGNLNDALSRHYLDSLNPPMPFDHPFKLNMNPFPDHDKVLEKSTEDFNEKLNRARDIYDRTGITMDVLP